jgi:hypothetical protein
MHPQVGRPIGEMIWPHASAVFPSFFHLSSQLAACSFFTSLTNRPTGDPHELQGTNCHARWVLMGASTQNRPYETGK